MTNQTEISPRYYITFKNNETFSMLCYQILFNNMHHLLSWKFYASHLRLVFLEIMKGMWECFLLLCKMYSWFSKSSVMTIYMHYHLEIIIQKPVSILHGVLRQYIGFDHIIIQFGSLQFKWGRSNKCWMIRI